MFLWMNKFEVPTAIGIIPIDFSPAETGTIKEDFVRYSVPGWLIEPMIHRKFVQAPVGKDI